VVEGRDIGAVVAPDARLKVYLTASSEERAKRRTRQDTRAGRTSSVDETRQDVDRRDRLDSSRAVSPLRRADDAVELDTSNLDAWGVVDTLLGMVERRGMRVCRVGG
jgi:cytidylate kinase